MTVVTGPRGQSANTGPYGLGVCCQIIGTWAATGPPSSAGPLRYTSRPFWIISPCAR